MEEKNSYNFKEGDWIVPVNNKVQIKEIKGGSIVLSDNTIISSESLNDYRKWSIYDAKKGDILYTKGGIGYERKGIIFICTGMENRDYIDEPCLGHAGFYSKDLNKFVPNTDNGFMGTISDNIKDGTRPATPKERELLFEKMKQAGYEYNTEDNTTYTLVRHQFMKDDFIVNKKTNEVFKIDKIVEDIITNEIIYMLADGKGYVSEETEDNYRIWTSQDVNDGDILYSPSHNIIWIHKEEYQKTYVLVNLNYPNCNVCIDGFFVAPSDTRPATKHECELLYQNLQKAGYEWNSEKKELRLMVTNL